MHDDNPSIADEDARIVHQEHQRAQGERSAALANMGEWTAVFGATYASQLRAKDSEYNADVRDWVEQLRPWNQDELCVLVARVMALIDRVQLSDFDDYPAGAENGFSSFVNDLHNILDGDA